MIYLSLRKINNMIHKWHLIGIKNCKYKKYMYLKKKMVTCNFVVYKPYYNSFAVEWRNAIKVYTSEWRDDCTNFIEYTIYDN